MQDYVIIHKMDWHSTVTDRYTRSEKHKNSNKNKQIKREKIKETSIDGLPKNITRCGRSRWWDQ